MIIKFFGQYLINRRIVTVPQLVAALEYQHTHNRMIGTYGVTSGQISEEGVKSILDLQANKDVMFGEGALELGLLTESQLKDLVLAQRENHILLGNALTALGYVDKATMEKALEEFKKEYGSDEELDLALSHEIADRNVVLRFLDFTQKLFMRKWGLRNKPIEIRVATDSLLLSDHNVLVTISGQWSGQFVLATPIEVTMKSAAFEGLPEPATDDDRDDVVVDFANTVCGNMVAYLADQGKEAKIESALSIASRYRLSDTQAIIMSFITSDGLVFAGVLMPRKK
jgi:CheY-specific phosphatase CheX